MEGDSRVQPVYYHCFNGVNTRWQFFLGAWDGGDGRAKTIFEVEREQRWRIWLLFALLLVVVFAGVWLACLVLAIWAEVLVPTGVAFRVVLDLRNTVLILAIAALVSSVYWYTSRIDARRAAPHRDARRTSRPRRPLPPAPCQHRRGTAHRDRCSAYRVRDGADARHERLRLQRHARRWGGRRDGGCALAPLEAAAAGGRGPRVRAHSLGDVRDGDRLVPALRHLLESGREAGGRGSPTGQTRGAPVALGALMLRGLVFVLQLASRITTSALSRERELEADVAAASYTRDPLSLAQALRLIGRHPGGAGYIPEGLAPCASGRTRAQLPGSSAAGRPAIRRWAGASTGCSPLPTSRRTSSSGRQRRPSSALTSASTCRDAAAAARGRSGRPGRGQPRASRRARARRSRPGRRFGPRHSAAAARPAVAQLRRIDYEGVNWRLVRRAAGGSSAADEVRRIAARREIAFSEQQVRLADLVAAQGDDLRRAAHLARGRPGRAPPRLPPLRPRHAAASLGLRARRRGRRVRRLRRDLVREGRARGAAAS